MILTVGAEMKHKLNSEEEFIRFFSFTMCVLPEERVSFSKKRFFYDETKEVLQALWNGQQQQCYKQQKLLINERKSLK